MLGNVKRSQQLAPQLGIKLKPIEIKLSGVITHLIMTLLPLSLYVSPSLAAKTVSGGSPQTRSVKPAGLLPAAKSLLPRLSFRLDSKPETFISPGKIRLMNQELKGLIGRFETTLLTADSQDSKLNISTSEAIQQRHGAKTITSKQNLEQSLKQDLKPILKPSLDFGSQSNYQDAHIALSRAKDGLRRFNYLASQKKFTQAQAEWTSAKEILWSNYPTDRPVAQSEVRGMWLDRGTIVKAKSEADLVKVFDRMAEAGINTVFFETINSGYTIYPSRIAPQQNPLVKGWDPLKAAIELAHARDMELHAWVWTFAAVNQRHNVILNLPRNYLGPVLTKHPDWALTDREGSNFHYTSGKVFLDPANPEVQSYLSSLVNEIATDYEVDGIHLDYIRYPFQSPTGKITYGYGKAAREQFQEQTGFDPIQLTTSHYMWSEWTEFKTEQIDQFVGKVSQNLQQLRPELILSTAVFPMPKQERLAKIHQHWEKWVDREWLDMVVPMTYAQNTERLDSLANPLLDIFDHGKALLLPGIRLLNISEVTALDQMQLLRGMSTEGYALFAAENLNSDFASVFKQTQGSISTDEQQFLPHREPFRVALSRYQNLQQEWNFFLTNNQLTTNELALQKWGGKADQFAEALQSLVDKPSNRNFFSTQVALNSLRRQFPQWMRETKEVEPYQAQVWQNRLDTLDRLLSYGENKVLNSNQEQVTR